MDRIWRLLYAPENGASAGGEAQLGAQPAAPGAPGASSATGAPNGGGSPTQGMTPAQVAAFHSWKGNQFATPADLDRYLETGTMRREAFKRSMDQVKADRTKFQDEQKQYQATLKQFEDLTGLAPAAFDALLRSNPQVLQGIARQLMPGQRGGGVQAAAPNGTDQMPPWAQQLVDRLDKVEGYTSTQQNQQQISQLIDAIAKDRPNLNRARVEEMVEEMGLLEGPELTRYIIDLAAHKAGESGSADALEAAQAAANAGVPPTASSPGTVSAGRGASAPNNVYKPQAKGGLDQLEEARQAAIARFGGLTE